MTSPMPAPAVLDREFLELRAKLLQLAASFDRLDRGHGTVDGDARIGLLSEALDILKSEEPNRAERIQMLFSRPYEDGWQRNYGMVRPPKK